MHIGKRVAIRLVEGMFGLSKCGEKILYFGSILLCLLFLGACESQRTLDLPEIKELKQEIFAVAPSIQDVKITYGNSLSLSIRIKGKEITDEQALSIVKRARALFSDASFHDKLFQALGSKPKEELTSNSHAPHITISIYDSAWTTETDHGQKYFFGADYYRSKEDSVPDGYNSWWGERESENEANCMGFAMEEILAAD